MSPSWLVPDWPAPANVRALSTHRMGGVSTGPYQSLNLGTHVGDVPEAVQENRRRLASAARLPTEPVWLRQVHGAEVADLDQAQSANRVAEEGRDAAISRCAGRVCAILTADCVPILLAADDGSVVGAAHAGWRGLRCGVLAATVRALDVGPERLMAWIGPSIGAAHYEVGAEVRAAMLRLDATAAAAFRLNERGRFMADLALLARQQLQGLGIRRIGGAMACTYADRERYFSYRRDGQTGRQATLIWLEAPQHR